LVHHGKLDWNKPVVSYLSDFQLKDPWISSHVTVADLLSHRTGIASHDAIWDGDTINYDSGFSVYQNLKHLEVKDQFRNSEVYSNIMYGVIGHLIAVVAGMPFVQFITENIFNPLGIKNYTWNTNEYRTNTNRFGTHALDLSPGENLEMVFKEIEPFDENIEFFYPAGALYTSTAEMTKWIQCLLRNGQNDQGDQVLYELETIWKVHNVSDVSELGDFSYSGYGFGWCISQYGPYSVYRHSGGMPGVETNVLICPKAKFGCYVAVNTGLDLAHLLSYWITSSVINYNDSVEKYIERVDQIPATIDSKLKEEFDEFWEGDLEIHPRFDEFVGKYFHPAYGKVEISLHSEKGHLKLFRSPVSKTLYPKRKSNDTFFQIAAEGYLTGFQWQFSFLGEAIILILNDEDTHIVFQKTSI
jgi:CubicO group peptidase (beta-lactamase class C family)